MAGLSVRNEVDTLTYENGGHMHCNVGNTDTVYTVNGFWHNSQEVQCYSSLLSFEHIAFFIHIAQPEPGAADSNSFIIITSDQIG